MANHINSYLCVMGEGALERLVHIITSHLTFPVQNRAREGSFAVLRDIAILLYEWCIVNIIINL